jgi:ABC-type glycerol-3-phosphate transport system substrate-binding protein
MSNDAPGRIPRPVRFSLLAVAGALSASLALAACGSADPVPTEPAKASSFTPADQTEGSELTVWADATRVPAVQAYEKAHPDVKIKLVTYSGDANGATDLQTKVQLFDRSGKGWPDVAFSTNYNDVAWAGSGEKPYAAPLSENIVPKATLSGFSAGALDPCTVGGTVYCLRNDLAQGVLWYNAELMKQFGYQVPTTWEEYQALGEKVAKEHPGYVIGTAGDPWTPEVYFWASQCPASTVSSGSGDKQVSVNLQDPKCTRMASLLDTLIKAKAVSTDTIFGAGFIKNTASKVLMMPGPSWYGQAVFNSTFKTPKGEIAAAPPLKFADDSQTYTGNVGGGVWFVSSHSQNLKGASDLVSWITSDDTYQSTAPGYPAVTTAAQAWLKEQTSSGYFSGDVTPALTAAAGEVWPGWSATQYSHEAIYASTVVPALTKGSTITETLGAWQKAIENKATSLGYTVK